MKDQKILVINPGSTSTKVAVFDNEKQIFSQNISLDKEEMKKFSHYLEEYSMRKKSIKDFLESRNFDIRDLTAVIGRGAPFKPLEGGTYRITDEMLDDIKNGRLQSPHISALGAVISNEFSKELNIPSFIADPVSVDEFHEFSRLSGMKEIPRKSLWHALNCKAIAREAAESLGRKYEDLDLIVVHLGGGITISAHQKGRAVDVNNGNSEGPFSPERTGTLPALELVEICYSGKYTKEEMIKKITKEGGLRSYLGTSDAREIEEKIIKNNDKEYKLIYETMAYQISKEIGAYATVLKGSVDAIVITGGIANSNMLVDWIKERVSFISKVLVFPGEDELSALAKAAFRVLTGQEKEKKY